jgi:hypothetical protein
MIRTVVQWVIIVFCATACPIFAGTNFEYDPITQVDWALEDDSAYADQYAVVIFEKIEADETKLLDQKCYLTLYRRIRILGPEGRRWGDVILPFIHKKQKIEKIYGRTVLRNQTIIPLTKQHIIEKEVLVTEGIKIKQKSFSLPGLTNNCIIEYAYTLRLPNPNSLWEIQKDVPLIRGVYHWKMYRGRGILDFLDWLFADFTNPNYLLVNYNQDIDLEYIPSPEEAREVIFTINNIPSFQSEPYSLPDDVLKTQLRLYYGSKASVDEY